MAAKGSRNATLLDPLIWRRIEAHLDQALDMEPPVRDQWLTDLARTQPGIAKALRELLAEHELLNDEGFLLNPPSASVNLAAADSSLTGLTIGPYTIDRLIGRGGMGEVWLAARSDGRFEGLYAIKFLDRVVSHDRLAYRFRQEGRLLARLAHPNVARLIDAGATDEGRQYLVLEYVHGERIDKYCESRSLSISARVRLFLDVVSAVAHAHSHLIVHRDLKPSNVLVTQDGIVKLLDFGIAKFLDKELTQDETARTRVEEVALTPDFAAPEQLLGEVPSTASDVYQLGMLLYVILLGTHPLQLLGSRSERMQAALNGQLPLASEYASAHLKKELRGDLDSIIATALRLEVNARYPTAAALAEDLQRYLNGEPVLARGGAAFYRLKKFVTRHGLTVTLGSIAVVALCASAIFAIGQARVAGLERDRALALASRNASVTDFLGTLIAEAAESSKPVTVSDMLARSEKLLSYDTGIKAEDHAAVLDMIANQYFAMDNVAKATQLHEQALRLLDKTTELGFRSRLICAHALEGFSVSQDPGAAQVIEQELTHLTGDPANAAMCSLYRSYVAAEQRDAVPALKFALDGLAQFRSSGFHQSAADDGLLLAAVAYGQYLNGNFAEADRYFQQAEQRFIDLGHSHSPNAMIVLNNWAVMLNDCGSPKRALAIYDQILQMAAERDELAEAPVMMLGNRAYALASIGRIQEARASFQLELGAAERAKLAMGKAHSLTGLAMLSHDLNDNAAAADYLHQARQLLDPSAPPNSAPQLRLAIIQGQLELAAGRTADASRSFDRVVEASNHQSLRIEALKGKAEAHLLEGSPRTAENDALAAVEAAGDLQGGLPYSYHSGESWLLLGRALQKLGDSAQAHKAFESAVNHLENTVDTDNPQLVQARLLAKQTQ